MNGNMIISVQKQGRHPRYSSKVCLRSHRHVYAIFLLFSPHKGSFIKVSSPAIYLSALLGSQIFSN